jgi:peptidyl-prolyl cis-trans isomerase B (cyclophilin B)
MTRRTIFILLILSIAILIFGCSKKDGEIPDENKQGGAEMVLEQLKMPEAGEEIAIIKTNHGDIKVRLFPKIAPKAVENFKTHAKNGYYDGVTFHRVFNEFMIQGGDPEGTGRGGQSIWGSPFEDEFDINYHNLRGALSMANAGPNTNGSQFFIVQKTDAGDKFIEQMEDIGEKGGFPEAVVEAYRELGGTPWLDYQHTVFGQVFEGMDVVDTIASVEADSNGRPAEPVIMETIEIRKYQ